MPKVERRSLDETAFRLQCGSSTLYSIISSHLSNKQVLEDQICKYVTEVVKIMKCLYNIQLKPISTYPIFPAVARLVSTSNFRILTWAGSELLMKKFLRWGSNMPLREPGPL